MLDPIRHQLTNLLTGYGYNLYEAKNRARADDLLVREKAAEQLADAASALRTLRSAFQKQFIPPLSRDNPEPPADRLEQLRRLARLQTRLEDLATRIRSMAVPTQDRTWERFRNEKTLLHQLLLHDYNLVAPGRQLGERAHSLTAADWTDDTAASLEGEADQIERAIRARTEFLQVPGW